MRAVALSDKMVQEKIRKSFIPLKVAILPGTETFPLDWPAMQGWRIAYRLMGGSKCEGITGCAVISPDLEVEFGNTGSAFVWEMFDSTAYDPEKFTAMLDHALKRFAREQEIASNRVLPQSVREWQLAHYRRQVSREIRREGRFRLPPQGFTVDGAIELFELSGDLPGK